MDILQTFCLLEKKFWQMVHEVVYDTVLRSPSVQVMADLHSWELLLLTEAPKPDQTCV